MYQPIKELAHSMRLFGVHRHAERRCEEALSHNHHPSELLRLILEDEKQARQEAVAKRLVSRAKFRSNLVLEEWNHSHDRGISKAKFKELAELNFLHKKQNLILLGNTGVGKTFLASSLGERLCHAGHSTTFHSVNLLFEQVAAEKAAGRYLKFISKLKKTAVLIFDDFGLRNYTHDEATVLLEILEERYQKGVSIITSQVSPEGWKSLFEDPVIGEAITDRIVNPSETVHLKGESYRKKLAKS
jgi:DNA replication protein DnaC